MTLSELVRSLSDHCEQQVEGRHILSISDTSEINLESHRGRLKSEGLGVVGYPYMFSTTNVTNASLPLIQPLTVPHTRL